MTARKAEEKNQKNRGELPKELKTRQAESGRFKALIKDVEEKARRT